MRLSTKKIALFAGMILLLVVCVVGVTMFATNRGKAPQVQASDPASTQPNTQPNTTTSNTAVPSVPGNSAQNPTSAPIVPQQPVAGGTYPMLVCDGSKPVLRVAFDAYAGFYPLVYQVMTMNSEHYCVDLEPKWYGPNFDINGWEEYQVESMLRNGELDVYFASNGTLALYDGSSGVVVWTTDQSRGADKVVAKNYIATAVDPTTGLPRPTFNDLLGRTIMVSPGNADHFLALKMLQTIGYTTNDVHFISPPDGSGGPVGAFNAGNGDSVAYWEPLVNDAVKEDTTVLVSTKWWSKGITDYVVISNQADQQKTNAVAHFLDDFNTATAAFTKDNLPATEQILASFEFDGYNMAGWMFLDMANLSSQMDNVALATLNDNVVMFQKDPTGSNLVVDQLLKSNKTWSYGGITTNGNPGSIFDAPRMVSAKYVDLLLNGGADQVRGEFSNAYDTTTENRLPPVDNNTLINLPELMTLPYKNIQFVPNHSSTLQPGEEEKLLAMTQSIAYLMSESDDSVIVIRGGAGGYSTNQAEMDFIRKFAFQRSQYIQQLLSKKLGIPIQRIVLDPDVLVPDHQPSNVPGPNGRSELDDYVVVIIRVVNTNEALAK